MIDKKQFIPSYLVIVILMMGCVTTEPILLRNNIGYDYSKQDEKTLLLKEQRPEWVIDFYKWKENEESKNSTKIYFLGQYTPEIKTLPGHLTLEKAVDEAKALAQREIGAAIRLEISNQIDMTSSGVTTNDSTFESKESVSIQTGTRFNVEIEGLHQESIFYEVFELSDKKKRIIAYHCYVLYSILKETMEEERQRLELLSKETDEKKIQESLEQRDKDIFSDLSKRYEEEKDKAEKINLLENEESQNKMYIEIYNNLLDIRSGLNRLYSLQNREDEIGKQYNKIQRDINEAIVKYDPSNRQNNFITSLQGQNKDKDMEIAHLQGQIEELRGLVKENLTVLPVIVPSLQKPNEIPIHSVKILAADDMVLNEDFISYSHRNKTNSFSREEQGLKAPAFSVSWNDAALYCNWLSKSYGYMPCYTESRGEITGYDSSKNGYRLPEYEEIIAILETQEHFVDELTKFGIWSSDNGPADHIVYRLSDESGALRERLVTQPLNNISDREVGFRVVRNAE